MNSAEKQTLDEQLREFNRCVIDKVYCERKLNKFLEGRDVILLRGKYKGRKARIKRLEGSNCEPAVKVEIYKINGAKGVIDDYYHEHYWLKEVQFINEV